MSFTQDYWDACLERIRESGAVLQTSAVADTKTSAVDAADYLLMTLASAYLLMSRADPDYPEFLPWVNHALPYGAANPDATYYWAPLDGEGDYRIFGYRNTTSWVDFMIGTDFWGFNDEPGPSYGSQQIDQMQIHDDGSFEIRLARSRPPGYTGNFIELKPTTNYLAIRQFAFAENEVDVRMGIERIDPVAPRRIDHAITQRRVDETIRHLRNSSRQWPSFLLRQGLKEGGYLNKFRVADYGGTGEVYGQIYLQGLYEIQPDEALLLKFKVPGKCRYWNIQLSDRLWRTLEHMNRQSSLNGYIDRADGDGITRLVVSHRDPGVANWVDACGVTEGDMIMRWLYVDAKPEVEVQRIAFDQLQNQLPADTRRVSADQRKEALRKRAMAMQLRRRW